LRGVRRAGKSRVGTGSEAGLANADSHWPHSEKGATRLFAPISSEWVSRPWLLGRMRVFRAERASSRRYFLRESRFPLQCPLSSQCRFPSREVPGRRVWEALGGFMKALEGYFFWKTRDGRENGLLTLRPLLFGRRGGHQSARGLSVVGVRAPVRADLSLRENAKNPAPNSMNRGTRLFAPIFFGLAGPVPINQRGRIGAFGKAWEALRRLWMLPAGSAGSHWSPGSQFPMRANQQGDKAKTRQNKPEPSRTHQFTERGELAGGGVAGVGAPESPWLSIGEKESRLGLRRCGWLLESCNLSASPRMPGAFFVLNSVGYIFSL
jgi:hypothetical protein